MTAANTRIAGVCLVAALITGHAGAVVAAESAWSMTSAVAARDGVEVSLQERTLAARCKLDLRPDRAVIVGGMTATAAKPAQAAARIEKQLTQLEKYVASMGGTLIRAERVRAARTAAQVADTTSPAAETFVVLQRLEVDVPASADIDAVFERLVEMGIDRFGRGLRVEYVDTNPKVVVHYRFSRLAEELEQLHRSCRESALEQWCTHNRSFVCDLSTMERKHTVATHSFALESQPILKEHGRLSVIALSYPWDQAQLDDVVTMSDMPLSLRGELTLGFTAPAEE